MANNIPNIFSLHQPDLLATDELTRILLERCPSLKNLKSMSKNQLVNLFRKVATPMAQRHYRRNRSGKLLTERRIKAGLQSKGGGTREACASGSAVNVTVATPQRVGTSDRLKPPPSGTSNIKIRLGSSSSEKDKGAEVNKVVVSSRSQQVSDSESTPSASSRKFVLKRSFFQCSKISCPSDSPSVKKQRTAMP